MIGIYKIENLINGKAYIGQSVVIENRWSQHKNNKGSKLLFSAFEKYGIDNFSFEVVEECEKEELNEKEQYWIKHYKTNEREYGYNILSGGGEGGELYSTEKILALWEQGYSIKEIQEELDIKNPSTIAKRLKGRKDYSAQEAHRRGARKSEKMNKSKTHFVGKPVYQYTLLGEYVANWSSIAEASRNFSSSENANQNIESCCRGRQQTAYGFQWSLEKLERLSPVSVSHGKLIRCKNTGEVFPSSKAAAKWANIKTPGNIIANCLGKRNSAGKHPKTKEKLIWEYYEPQ